jgi:hypothetical protein
MANNDRFDGALAELRTQGLDVTVHNPSQDRALIKRIEEQETVKGDLAKPFGVAAVVRVGAATETEMKDEKARVEECGAKHELPGRRHRSRRRRSFPPSHS